MKVAVLVAVEAAAFQFPCSLPLQPMQYLEVTLCPDDPPPPKAFIIKSDSQLSFSKVSSPVGLRRGALDVHPYSSLSQRAWFALMPTSGSITESWMTLFPAESHLEVYGVLFKFGKSTLPIPLPQMVRRAILWIYLDSSQSKQGIRRSQWGSAGGREGQERLMQKESCRCRLCLDFQRWFYNYRNSNLL